MQIIPGMQGYFQPGNGVEDAPGWTVESLKISRKEKSNGDWFEPTPGHPLNGMEEGFEFAVIEVEVKRASNFYMLNLVLPIVLLTFLSWTSFMLEPDCIEARLATVMTIMLAMIGAPQPKAPARSPPAPTLGRAARELTPHHPAPPSPRSRLPRPQLSSSL